MAAIEKKPIKITETVLRDAHQSLIATRLTTEQMLPIVDKMDKVGYHSVECWGGATFDASLRFLKEEVPEKKKAALGVRAMKLADKDYLEQGYLLESRMEYQTEYKGKQMILNKIKLGKRDTKGTKVRV